ncbi:MAG: hypothetical protein ACOY5B_14370 [Spirochaetota bacterium]
MNIKMAYLYRDGGNYKTWQEVVFTNHSGKTAEQLSDEIKQRLISGQFFDQGRAPIPFEYPDSYDPELDHTWLEFDSFEEVDETPTVSLDIYEFIASLTASSS